MSTIGIIANPASGRDIRRLVTHASVFDNQEKAHILRRVFLALDALRVQQVIYMPDYDSLVEKALKGLKLSLKATQLHMDMWGEENPTRQRLADVFPKVKSTASSPSVAMVPTVLSPRAAAASP